VREGITPALASPDLVLESQPHSRVVVERAICFEGGTDTEVIGPPAKRWPLSGANPIQGFNLWRCEAHCHRKRVPSDRRRFAAESNSRSLKEDSGRMQHESLISTSGYAGGDLPL
jgi:hypothetical protein